MKDLIPFLSNYANSFSATYAFRFSSTLVTHVILVLMVLIFFLESTIVFEFFGGLLQHCSRMLCCLIPKGLRVFMRSPI
jgi:hypothetical protein